MVGALDGAGGLCSCSESARLPPFNREIYATSGVEEVQARIEDRLIYRFEVEFDSFSV
jgi:hypothetical protein